MPKLTITSKGQVTLRKDFLEHLGAHPGDKLTVEKRPDGRIEVYAERMGKPISDLFGIMRPKDGVSLSLEEINRAIEDGWAGKR